MEGLLIMELLFLGGCKCLLSGFISVTCFQCYFWWRFFQGLVTFANFIVLK